VCAAIRSCAAVFDDAFLNASVNCRRSAWPRSVTARSGQLRVDPPRRRNSKRKRWPNVCGAVAALFLTRRSIRIPRRKHELVSPLRPHPSSVHFFAVNVDCRATTPDLRVQRCATDSRTRSTISHVPPVTPGANPVFIKVGSSLLTRSVREALRKRSREFAGCRLSSAHPPPLPPPPRRLNRR
jgi:hypothetical protein